MIESFRIRNFATFDSEGAEISNLKPVNFIYGANGTGKTTISRFLSDIDHPDFIDSNVNWKNDNQMTTLVYNKPFREKIFAEGKTPGVFTLGNATQEDIAQIKMMSISKNTLNESINLKKKELSKEEGKKQEEVEEFTDFVWNNIHSKYKSMFRKAFQGYMGSKKSFKEKLLEENASNDADLLAINDLEEKTSVLFRERPEKLVPIREINNCRHIDIEKDEIWKKAIIGSGDVNIARLISTLNNSDWVSKGRVYIQEGSNVCPFCQQESITSKFRDDIERFFDKSFTDDISRLRELSFEFADHFSSIEKTLNEILDAESLKEDSKLDREMFKAKTDSLLSTLSLNRQKILTKITEPSRSISLQSTEIIVDEVSGLISMANNKISNHNTLVDQYEVEKVNLISAVWKFVLEENSTFVSQHLAKIKGFDNNINNLKSQLSSLTTEHATISSRIVAANKNITSIQPSIDNINALLKGYGFDNFEIVKTEDEEGYYSFKREDGSIANSTLSEGEITFLTFLYFMQCVQGTSSQNEIIEDRIIIVDDPISSLDSNILFVVSSLLRKLIKDIKKDEGNVKQLILLTHNVYFHKEVSFIFGKAKKDKKTHFWILRREGKQTFAYKYEQTNPIRNYYELLWKELRSGKKTSSLATPNNMRRILEHYFKMLGSIDLFKLPEKFAAPEDKIACRSLLSWANDGSHSIPDSLYIQQNDDTLEIYWAVFENIFKNMNHHEHYKMMMENRN